jgi:hypothetical protein
MQILPLVIGSISALGFVFGAFVCQRRKRLIDDLPTSKTQGVFIGLTELKGTAESETPLTSYLGGIRCVEYRWEVDEHWSRTVTYVDSKGVHSRTESGWIKVAGGGEKPPFYLKDDTGVIRIDPDGASITDVSTFYRTCGQSDPLYFAHGPLSAVADSTHQRRFKENALPLHSMLYVMGQARECKDVVAAEISHDKNAPLFVISVKTEKQISSSYISWIWLWVVLGYLAAMTAVFFARPSGTAGTGGWQQFITGTIIYLLVFAAGWTLTVFNSLIALKNRVNEAWSQVEIQLKRRSDLIPNLASCVEGYSSHEKAAQILVAELRNQAEIYGETREIKGYGPAVAAIAESYPALKADQSFLALQKSLTETEQRIALARMYFNDIVTFYNTRLDIIPDRFIGSMARLFKQNTLKAADLERAPVNVCLAT